MLLNPSETEAVAKLLNLLTKHQFSSYVQAIRDSNVPLAYKVFLHSVVLDKLETINPVILGEYISWATHAFPLPKMRGWYEFLPPLTANEIYPQITFFSDIQVLMSFLSFHYHAWLLSFIFVKQKNYEEYINAFRSSILPLQTKFELHYGLLYAWELEAKSHPEKDKDNKGDFTELTQHIIEQYGSVLNALDGEVSYD